MGTVLGIIGGSGLYDIEGIENPQWIGVESSFGDPSDDLLFGEIGGLKIVFLPRHGRNHIHSPSQINYRANIDALKRAGVTDIISVSACGSFREEMAPQDFVLVDQFIDRTIAREKSFFDDGLVAHVSVAHPTCSGLCDVVEKAAERLAIKLHRGGTYLAMEGPQFSTLAESNMYRAWGCDVIGMTNMPEAKLAREAEICYGTVAMVTDYDSWHPEHGEVDVSEIIKTLGANVENAKDLVKNIIMVLAVTNDRHPCAQACDHALDNAIVTKGDLDARVKTKLSAIAGRVLNQ